MVKISRVEQRCPAGTLSPLSNMTAKSPSRARRSRSQATWLIYSPKTFQGCETIEEDLPTRDRILLWATLTMLLLAILTTPVSHLAFILLSVGCSVSVAGSDIGPRVLDIMVGPLKPASRALR
jgi:hypothetical protein